VKIAINALMVEGNFHIVPKIGLEIGLELFQKDYFVLKKQYLEKELYISTFQLYKQRRS